MYCQFSATVHCGTLLTSNLHLTEPFAAHSLVAADLLGPLQPPPHMVVGQDPHTLHLERRNLWNHLNKGAVWANLPAQAVMFYTHCLWDHTLIAYLNITHSKPLNHVQTYTHLLSAGNGVAEDIESAVARCDSRKPSELISTFWRMKGVLGARVPLPTVC